MKKLFAILLGLALTLGFASVASAAFAVSGQYVVATDFYFEEDYFEFTGPFLHGDTRMEVKLTGAYGPISGDLTYRFKDNIVDFRSGKAMYKFSDEISAGIVSSDAGTVYYASPVDGDETKYYGTGAKGELNFGDFKADVFSNLYYENDDSDKTYDLTFFGDAEFAMDPVTFYLPFSFDKTYSDDSGDELVQFGITPAVKYAITDELFVAAEFGYASVQWTDASVLIFDESEMWVGIGAEYATDVLTVYGSFDYCLDEIMYGDDGDVDLDNEWMLFSDVDAIVSYVVGVEFQVTDALLLYAEYAVDEWDQNAWYEPHLHYCSYGLAYSEELTVGLEWNMDGAEKSMLVVEGVYDCIDETLDILAKWTLKFS